MHFLENNPLNFMQALGLHSFSDRLFVLCAGCTELLFALVFLLGLITRINTLVLGGFLVSSNLFFFLVGRAEEGVVELIGHLPLLATALILVLYGGGRRWRLSNLFPRTAQQGAGGEG